MSSKTTRTHIIFTLTQDFYYKIKKSTSLEVDSFSYLTLYNLSIISAIMPILYDYTLYVSTMKIHLCHHM